MNAEITSDKIDIKPGELLFEAEIDIRPVPWKRSGGNLRRRYTPDVLREYYETLGWLLKAKGLNPIEGHIGVAAIFSRTGMRSPDDDNLYKALMDGCKPFFDDKMVRWHLSIARIGVEKDSIKMWIWRDADAMH